MEIIVKNSFFYIPPAFVDNMRHDMVNDYKKVVSYTPTASFGREFGREWLTRIDDRSGLLKIPAGLLFGFLDLLKKHQIRYTLKDSRGAINEQIPLQTYLDRLKGLGGYDERDYQVEAIRTALRSRRGIINHATAAGKTVTLAGMIYCANSETLFLCHKKGQAKQAWKDLSYLTGYETGRFFEGIKETNKFIVVATVQSINAWLARDQAACVKFLKTRKCVIGDEIHHSSSVTWRMVFYNCINAIYKFGATGTVHREDGRIMELVAVTGPIIHTKSATSLIREGYVAQPIIDILRYEKADLNMSGVLWHELYKEGIVHNKERNYLICKSAQLFMKREKQVLIIVVSVEHGEILSKALNMPFISGKENTYIRDKRLEEFQSCAIPGLIASVILDEAINVPNIDAIILAGGGKAQNSIYQRIGRGMRLSAERNKTVCRIIDFADDFNFTLMRQSWKRVEIMRKEEGFVVRKSNKYIKTPV